MLLKALRNQEMISVKLEDVQDNDLVLTETKTRYRLVDNALKAGYIPEAIPGSIVRKIAIQRGLLSS